MSAEASNNTALLTEHLSYPPVTLLDDIINSVNLIGFKAVDAVETGLLSAPFANLGFIRGENETEAELEARAKDEIENGVHQFETLLSASIDKNFDKMEIYALRSLIAIPEDLKDWVRLRHYEAGVALLSILRISGRSGWEEGLNFALSPDAPTTESITLQRRKQRETLRLHRLLLAEEARNAAIIAQLKALTVPITIKPEQTPEKSQGPRDPAAFAFLQSKGDLPSSSKSTPLTTTTQFALSQLPALKVLLAQLRPAMQTLSKESAVVPRDPNLAKQQRSFRGERFDYVESQTRRQLELRGVELDAQGKVRDGEWQSEGRQLGKGEVESLERVVALVRGEDVDEAS